MFLNRISLSPFPDSAEVWGGGDGHTNRVRSQDQSQLGWETPLGSLSPTCDPTAPCHPDRGTQCHIQFLKHLQGVWVVADGHTNRVRFQDQSQLGWKTPLGSLAPTQHHLVKQIMALSATSSSSLSTSMDGDSTVSLGSPLQCQITLSVRKFILMSNLNLSWCRFTPCPLFLEEEADPQLHV